MCLPLAMELTIMKKTWEYLRNSYTTKNESKTCNMKYFELIKKTIIVTITVFITVILLWIIIGFITKNSIRIVSDEERLIKSEFRK